MKTWKKWIITALCVIMTAGCVTTAEAYSKTTSKGSDICQHGSCKKKKLSGSNFCVNHTCAEPGCYKEVNSANERCSKHKTEYYKKLGIYDSNGQKKTTCNVDGCGKTRASGSSYCSSHTCAKKNCTKKVKSGSRYCASHTCIYPGCTREVSGANEKCSTHKNASYPWPSNSSSSSGSGGTTTHTSGSSNGVDKSKYSDYEEMYEDNEDDFEDLDDAEDYWDEN